MKLQIKYFGLTAEKTGTQEEWIETEVRSVADVRSVLEKRHPGLSGVFFRLAVNLALSPEDYEVNENDEIALLPAFAGG
jgi:sulfur-carrier protein